METKRVSMVCCRSISAVKGVPRSRSSCLGQGKRTAPIAVWVSHSMDLIIQHEYYREFLASQGATRDVEADAAEAERAEEKVYE